MELLSVLHSLTCVPIWLLIHYFRHKNMGAQWINAINNLKGRHSCCPYLVPYYKEIEHVGEANPKAWHWT